MLKCCLIILSIIFTCFYFFPFEFIFLPGINTKMAMAGIGLVVLGIRLANSPLPTVNKDFFVLSIVGLLISLMSLLTMNYNSTNDSSFLSYIVSIWVWLGGAYCLTQWLKKVHGYLSVILVANYLIAVCVMQCFIAYMMNIYDPLKEFVDGLLGGEVYMGKTTRLHGIGAALDVAGTRFAAVLAIVGYLCVRLGQTEKSCYVKWYIIAFGIISVIGCMIGRTTTIGIILALGYWIWNYFSKDKALRGINQNLHLKWLMGILITGLPILIYLYYTDLTFYKNIRFGFEGFFSLWEKGKWEVQSNEALMNMWVIPKTLKTWLIGDGYGGNPSVDLYYTGPIYHGFYMGTDIGYLRFIFYFGIVGAWLLIFFFIKSVKMCMAWFPYEKVMFLLLLIVNFLVWFKVSTDIFPVFAPFFCIGKDENDAYNERITKYTSIIC